MTHEKQLASEKANVLNLPHFKFYTKGDILSLTKLRRFETKLGEGLQVLDNHTVDSFERLDVKYVILVSRKILVYRQIWV